MVSVPKTNLESPVDLTLYKYLLPESEWQQLWFSLLTRKWSSLAVVPSHPGISSLFVAQALCDVGKLHRQKPVHLVNAEGVHLVDASSFIDSLGDVAARGDIALVAVDSPLENQAAIPISRSAEAALLVVPLGESTFRNAQRTVELLGRERFIGSITLKSEGT